ncbi:hypothetical protein TSUD_08100 [Trifolium subterraneum]|nr:hypothetical protein TSUD_08100 [Trifolium subterraneum]
MIPADLMRAVVPVFPPSESHLVRDGYLRGERNPGHLRCSPSEFFMLFDVNSDGLISFKDGYYLLVTKDILVLVWEMGKIRVGASSLSRIWEITKEEFKKVMALMRSHHRQGVQHRDGLRIGLKVNDSVENGGLLEYFFGKDGKSSLQLDNFVQFLRDLNDEGLGSFAPLKFPPSLVFCSYVREDSLSSKCTVSSSPCLNIVVFSGVMAQTIMILRLEFAHYDYKSRKTISAKDFALSMVASADMSHLGKLLERVDELSNDPCFKDVRITFEDFKNFAELRKKLFPLSLALFTFGKVNGLLTRDDFQRAASHVCGISLSDNVVDIVFHLFDTNQDGNLSTDEFVRVLHKRERDIGHPVETGMLSLLSCCWNCKENISSSRLFSS